MAIEQTDINRFLELAKLSPVIDARSPKEFAHAHIPGAVSLPLFSDEERKVVGTAYKQKSREEAIKIGLDFFGVKMRKMVEEVETILTRWPSKFPTGKEADKGSVLVHCWRGGMRSSAVAWLLDLYGFKVYLLQGGYKKFREHVLDTFKISYNCKILGGYTGSRKTAVLNSMKAKGVSIVDLEKLANHKGSAFGKIGQQPSQEMFENLLALALREEAPNGLVESGNFIWLEDESQRIGEVNIPNAFWEQMRESPICFMEVPFEQRLGNIISEYGDTSKQDLTEAILRIQKRLGGLETKNAIYHLSQNDLRSCFSILLAYYDKWYRKNYLSRPASIPLNTSILCESTDVSENAGVVLQAFNLKQTIH